MPCRPACPVHHSPVAPPRSAALPAPLQAQNETLKAQLNASISGGIASYLQSQGYANASAWVVSFFPGSIYADVQVRGGCSS